MSRGRPRSTSLPYVPIDPHIETHQRMSAFVDALAEHTKLPETLLTIIPRRLIEWAGRQHIDGNIGSPSAKFLARLLASEFRLPPDKLLHALTDEKNGFLVELPDGSLALHDWEDYGGMVLEIREKWANEKSEQRARKQNLRELSGRTNGGHPPDIHETSDGRPPDVCRTSALEAEAEAEAEVLRDEALTLPDIESLLAGPPYHWGVALDRRAAELLRPLGAIPTSVVQDAMAETLQAGKPNALYFARCVVTKMAPRPPPRRRKNRAEIQLEEQAAAMGYRRTESGDYEPIS